MRKIERSLLQYEQQKKTNELVGSQYAYDVCENVWMQSLCVISRVDNFYKMLAGLHMADITCAPYRQYAVKHLEEYYFTLV